MKAVVQFRGREIAHTDLGRKLLIRFSEDLAPTAPPKERLASKAATPMCC